MVLYESRDDAVNGAQTKERLSPQGIIEAKSLCTPEGGLYRSLLIRSPNRLGTCNSIHSHGRQGGTPKALGDVVYMDIQGPYRGGVSGVKYFYAFVDEAYREKLVVGKRTRYRGRCNCSLVEVNVPRERGGQVHPWKQSSRVCESGEVS